LFVILTDARLGIVAEQPTLRAETFSFAQKLIESDTTIITAAATDRGYNEYFTRAIMSCILEVNICEFQIDIRVTTFAITGILVSSITA